MRYVIAIIIGSTVVVLAVRAEAATYAGSLTYDGTPGKPPPSATDGLYVRGPAWPGYDLTIEWTVTDTDNSQPGFPWKYSYHFRLVAPQGQTLQGGISHVIIEGSEGISSANVTGISGNAAIENPADDVGLQQAQSGNPDIPEDLVGLRFHPTASDTFDLEWEFFSDRDPVWGDWYAKCGGGPGGVFNTAYNYNDDGQGNSAGFLDPDNVDTVIDDIDPTDHPSLGTAENHYFWHILRPDSTTSQTPPDEVPEPVSLALVGVATLSLGGYLRRRRQA